MLCYRDMAFCSAKCANSLCERNWETMDKTNYAQWSKSFPDGRGPVAFTDFSSDCKAYVPMEIS